METAISTIRRVFTSSSWYDFSKENIQRLFIPRILIGVLVFAVFIQTLIEFNHFSPLRHFKGDGIEITSEISSKLNPETYSFKNVVTSFGLVELAHFENIDAHLVDQVFLASFPKYMQEKVKPFAKAILKLSEKHQIDPFWVASIMWTESHFNWKAKSHVGATGLMQIMPKTKKWLYWKLRKNGQFLTVERDDFKFSDYFKQKLNSKEKRVYKYRLVNIELGIIYLNRLLKRFKGNHTLATVAYNMGPGWTRKRLQSNLPVGKKNKYLTKVKLAYRKLSDGLWQLHL